MFWDIFSGLPVVQDRRDVDVTKRTAQAKSNKINNALASHAAISKRTSHLKAPKGSSRIAGGRRLQSLVTDRAEKKAQPATAVLTCWRAKLAACLVVRDRSELALNWEESDSVQEVL